MIQENDEEKATTLNVYASVRQLLDKKQRTGPLKKLMGIQVDMQEALLSSNDTFKYVESIFGDGVKTMQSQDFTNREGKFPVKDLVLNGKIRFDPNMARYRLLSTPLGQFTGLRDNFKPNYELGVL